MHSYPCLHARTNRMNTTGQKRTSGAPMRPHKPRLPTLYKERTKRMDQGTKRVALKYTKSKVAGVSGSTVQREVAASAATAKDHSRSLFGRVICTSLYNHTPSSEIDSFGPKNGDRGRMTIVDTGSIAGHRACRWKRTPHMAPNLGQEWRKEWPRTLIVPAIAEAKNRHGRTVTTSQV